VALIALMIATLNPQASRQRGFAFDDFSQPAARLDFFPHRRT